ncbi:hypothetical protein F6X39_29640 [Paraburkholderia sp. UCT2]|nr:hypothetical protein [Paraburkholderia sp. UCT2]
MADSHVFELRLSCTGVADFAARKVQVARQAMSSKTFQHNCDVSEPECPNDAISMGPEIYVTSPGTCAKLPNVCRYHFSISTRAN